MGDKVQNWMTVLVWSLMRVVHHSRIACKSQWSHVKPKAGQGGERERDRDRERDREEHIQ
jgi:hypothetical protein